MDLRSAYLVAGKRTALGRIGGLHRQRRIEDLAGPVILEALKEARLESAQVDRVVIGNVTAGNNPARVVALAAGLPDQVPAVSIDQQCASGLEAVLAAARIIAVGEADVVVAGGVESLSTAPWRIAKPRTLQQTPRFLGVGMADRTEEQENFAIEAAEELARRLGISRADQDAMALRSHLQAALARDGRHLLREVVPLKNTAEEFRDQSADAPEPEDLQEMPTLVAGGTLTRGNTSALHDGAAILVAVSGGMWERLGRPPALRVAAGAATGVPPAQEIEAPILALRRLLDRIPGRTIASLGVVEMSEQSAVQAIALRRELGIADDALNPDGGAIVRGHPLAAAGAVLVVRLFSRMVRARSDASARLGAAVLGASGGQGVAALFEAA